MNEALKNILERNSHRQLDLPVPSIKEMKKVYQAALRAPDHAWLRPSSFIEIQGKGLDKLSKAFVDFAEENIANLLPEKLEKYKNAPFRAPMVIVLVNTPKEHPKVPEVEQIMSTAAAAETPHFSSSALDNSAASITVKFDSSSTIFSILAIFLLL